MKSRLLKRQRFTNALDAFTSRNSKGFTLIELLVVIAIIAILAAILFPVFAQAREKARQTACLSNTKQMALAVQQYLQDYDETFMHAVAGNPPSPLVASYTDINSKNGTGTYTEHWMQQLFPYMKSWGVYLCPSDTNPYLAFNAAGNQNGSGAPPSDSSYGYNAQLIQNLVAGNNYQFRGSAPLPQLISPSSIYLFSETAQAQKFFGYRGSCSSMSGYPNATRLDTVRFANAPKAACSNAYPERTAFAGNEDAKTRHAGGENIVYADAHAKWSKWNNILDKYTCMNPDGAGTGGCNGDL